MEIPNPIIRGFNPDPSICRVGNDYYLATSSFEYAPGIPLYHSRDLLKWSHVGYALPERRHLPLDLSGVAQGIWAPTLRYIRERFYVTYMLAANKTWPDLFQNFYVSAPSIEGPWSDPVYVTNGGIDPDLFEDEDGSVYFSFKGAMTAKIDLETGKLTEPLRRLWEGTRGDYAEAAHIYRANGNYYVMLAQGGTGPGHSVTIARSPTLEGPFVPCPWNPVLTHRGTSRRVQSTGHADMVQTPDGQWYAVCLGVRDISGISPLGRETHLTPVTWRDDWPVFGEEGRMADIESQTEPAPEPADLRDDFTSPVRPFFWNTRLGWGEKTITCGEGTLRLTPNGKTLQDDAEMAWLGLRQPDFNVAGGITLDPGTLAEGQAAGFCVYVNPQYHLVLQLRRESGVLLVEAIFRAGETRALLAKEILPSDTPRRLGIESQIRDEYGSLHGAYILKHADLESEVAESAEFARADIRSFGGIVTGTGFTGAFFAAFAEGTDSPVAFTDFKLLSSWKRANSSRAEGA